MIRKIGNVLDEQETIINIDPTQISKFATVYTTIPNDLKKMWALHEKYPDEVKVLHDDKWGSEFQVPRKWISVKRPRTMTEEQRIAASERLAKARETFADSKQS